jgi:hypothetical protein
MPTIADLKQTLYRYKDDEPCAYALWTTGDVLQVLEEEGRLREKIDITEVLDAVDRNADANVGINWDLIRECLPPKKKGKKAK